MSGQAKHTPGPWFPQEVAYAPYRKLSVRCGRGQVALIQALETEEDEANARLIAAAPDLLAACRLTLGAINDLLAAQLEYPDPSPSLVQLAAIRSIEPARAAIAQAEGRGRS